MREEAKDGDGEEEENKENEVRCYVKIARVRECNRLDNGHYRPAASNEPELQRHEPCATRNPFGYLVLSVFWIATNLLLAAGATLESSFIRDQAPPQMLLVSEEANTTNREAAMEQDLASGLASELQNSVDNGLLDAQLVEANLALLSDVRTTLTPVGTLHVNSLDDQLQVLERILVHS